MESMGIIAAPLLAAFKDKRVLITGHTGFKGAWLTFVLDAAGAHTLGYALAPQTTPSLYKNTNFSSRHSSIIGDIRDFEFFEKSVLGFKPDYIFHLAAQALVFEAYANPLQNFETNFNGSLNLLEILRKSNIDCTAVFITTDKVYENNNKNIPFKETDPLGGKDPYSASKAACELLINAYNHSFFKDSSIKIATARAGNVIGGGDWSEKRIVPDIVRALFENSPLEIRNPAAVRPWQHVLEPVFGYLLLAHKLSKAPEKFSTSWNFGPNITDNLAVKDLISHIEQLGHRLSINYLNAQPFLEAHLLRLNIEKTHKNLRFKPVWTAKEAIQKTISWYESFYSGVPVNTILMKDITNFIKSYE